MDLEDLELEEGPLSDISSCQNQTAQDESHEEEGFSIEYLLGSRGQEPQPGSEDLQSQFYRLQIEETLFSSLDSNLDPPTNESTRLRLENQTEAQANKKDSNRLRLDLSAQPQSGQIVFSPGGSEAFVFPRQEPEKFSREDHRPEGQRPTTVGQALDEIPRPTGSRPRELDEEIPVSREEFLQENPVYPNDEESLSNRRPQYQASGILPGRLDDFKTSQDVAASGQDVPSSLSSSANPSPRRYRFPAGIRERFLLQDPDNYYNMQSVSEHELTGDAESAAETMSPLMTSRGMSSVDRATSPSMASVTSGHSAASSIGGPGVRRHLEWDSGADLGYFGSLLAQRDAAASLSTLEKLAIGNYSNFFRTEPEGKSSRDRAAAAAARTLPTLPRLPPGVDPEEEMRQMRLHKFADSLLRQRQYHQATKIQSEAVNSANTSFQRADSEPPKTHPVGRSKSDNTPEVSPSRRRKRHRNRKSIASSNHDVTRTVYGSPMRSSSLTDLSRLSGRRSSRSNNSDWFSRKSSPPTAHLSEPSSSSSTATVVPLRDVEQDSDSANNLILRAINTDPRSLPPELQGMLNQDLSNLNQGLSIGGPVNWRNIPGRNSQTSLSSRQSASRSFETVIRVPDSDSLDTEDEIQLIRKSANLQSQESAQPVLKNPTWATARIVADTRAKSLPKEAAEDSSHRSANVWQAQSLNDYEEEIRIRQFTAQQRHKQVWTTSNDETDSGFKRNENCQPPSKENSVRSGRRSVGTHTARWAGWARAADRGSSIAATTSEDDIQNSENSGARLRERRRPSFPTNTSTLESASHIDRAKSFEYFPGESFPLQENSSSYEYLPGHMVDDRPGTVVSQRGSNLEHSHKRSERATSRNSAAYASATTRDFGAYTSEYLTTEDTTSPRSSSSGTGDLLSTKKASPSKESPGTGNDLRFLSRELRHKSKELHTAHLAQSKELYRRLKKYIAFVSTPSLTPDDCRIKQDVAAQILSLVKNEESKLGNIRPLSSQLGHVISPKNDDSLHSVQSENIATAQQAAPAPSANNNTSVDMTDRGGGAGRKQQHRSSRSSLSDLSVEIANVTAGTGNIDSLLKGANLSTIDIEVQKLRVEQMRRLRKELRKLEKLERLRLNKAVGGSPSVDAELMRQIQDHENSFDSVSTSVTDISTKPISSKSMSTRPISTSRSDRRLVVEGQSATSGSDTNPGITTTSTQVVEASSISPKPLPSFESRSSSQPKTSTNSKKFEKSSAGAKKVDKKSLNEKASDFGQTFPTPRRETEKKEKAQTEEFGVLTEPAAGAENRSNKSTKTVTSQKRKPLAFYLPVDNQSPIIVGQRILREKNRENFLGKENRNILANYVASLSSGVTKISRKPDLSPSPDVGNPVTVRLSLQDSLAKNRPDFIEKSNYRTQRLREMREKRLEYEEQVRNWLANASSADCTPPPVAANHAQAIPRLFDYRSMVSEARKKYLALPEVQRRQMEMQRRSNYRTNRLMASVFKRRLKNRVLQGQISMSHRNGVI